MTASKANLATILLDSAARHPERTAISDGTQAVSYRELAEASGRAAAWLRSYYGVRPGDRVALMVPNVPAFPVLYYGILLAGGVVVPMNPLLKQREITYYLNDSQAAAFLAWHECANDAAAGARAAHVPYILAGPDALEPRLRRHHPEPGPAPRARSDTAVILYTSGTTGRPKGAELTHDNLARNTEVTRSTLLLLSRTDVVLGALPLFHSFGQVVAMNCAISSGASLVLLPRFDPATTLATIDRCQVTVFAGVPTMYAALLGCPGRGCHDTRSLRLCVSGGAALPPEVLRDFESAFGCDILEGYGLSETSPVACFNHPGRTRKPGTVGTPIQGVQVRIIDQAGREVAPGQVGELTIRGHNVMKGYWRRPDATADAIPDGWLRTGDLGTTDADGYIRIVDRKKDLIIRGGYNIYPREIEEVLYEHPAVSEAAVIGVPHPTLGEEVAAAVVLWPGASTRPDELREFVKAQVAAYKYPRHLWILSALPKGPTGKILKREITAPASTDAITAAAP